MNTELQKIDNLLKQKYNYIGTFTQLSVINGEPLVDHGARAYLLDRICRSQEDLSSVPRKKAKAFCMTEDKIVAIDFISREDTYFDDEYVFNETVAAIKSVLYKNNLDTSVHVELRIIQENLYIDDHEGHTVIANINKGFSSKSYHHNPSRKRESPKNFQNWLDRAILKNDYLP